MPLRAATLALALTACATPNPAPPPAVSDVAHPALLGRLQVHDITPGRLSVDAYLGEEFVLTDGAQRWVLAPSEMVSREQLIALDGKNIAVVATRTPAQAPDPREAFPTNPDGSPLARADRWVVQHVERAP